jgi:peptidoglycan hydrolase-like protein with peptidoglycan-binding domain
MVYPNYYTRRLTTQAGWHRPGYASGVRRTGYGYRPGAYGSYGLHQYAHRAGYFGAGNYARRYPLRYGVGQQQRWSWLRNLGQRSRYLPQTYGYSQPGIAYAPPSPAGYAPPAPPSPALAPQWVAWAQSCLGQALGAAVPQDGVMGPATRHAIRKFQKVQQLPPTGMLDAGTINALQAACSGQAGAPPAPPAPPPGDDVAAATAAAAAGAPPPVGLPDSAAAPPDAGAPPDAAGPPPAPSGELFIGGRRRRHRRRWGSGFNFQQATQPPDSDDDGELFMGMGRGRFRRGWGGGMGNQQGYQQDDDGDGGQAHWPRRRW